MKNLCVRLHQVKRGCYAHAFVALAPLDQYTGIASIPLYR